MKKFAEKIVKYLLILFPPLFFFSYYPIISLGSDNYMNFELSLPEIWLVLFFFVSLPSFKVIYKFYGWKKLALTALIPGYLTLSVIWSENRPRAILTAGLLWLLVFAALQLIYRLKMDKTGKLRTSLIKSLLVSAVVVSAFCWLQCILDIMSIPREATLLCRGCIATTFGFPHPSGFAIEPQFMGNLLLAPVLLCYYLLSKPFTKTSSRNWFIVLTLFLSTTLFLTLSRGAIYAFLVALFVMFMLIRKRSMLFHGIACAFISLIIALTSFGVFSALGPTPDTFIDGATKAIHQLTLGKVDFRPTAASNSFNTNTDSSISDITTKLTDTTKPDNAAHFSGYVEESTNTRLSLNSLAIRTWLTSPRFILIGTGLGSAGPAMNHAFPTEIGPKEIVQNEYVSLLLETGLVGAAIILAVVIFTTVYLAKKKFLKTNPLFICVIIGFSFTLLFFSGLPNALHLYLFPLLLFNFNRSTKDDFLIENKI